MEKNCWLNTTTLHCFQASQFRRLCNKINTEMCLSVLLKFMKFRPSRQTAMQCHTPFSQYTQLVNFRFFTPCIFYICYNKNYQQMQLFVLCLYFLFLVFSLHVSGLHGPIIRGISRCCFYATIWFMQCFVDRLRASADWFVVVPDARRRSTKHCMNQMVS